MAFPKFEGNRYRIDGEITENHAILVNLTANIVYHHLAAVKNFVMIGIEQTDSYNGCFITFQQSFLVCLRGKLIQVKMSLYKLMEMEMK